VAEAPRALPGPVDECRQDRDKQDSLKLGPQQQGARESGRAENELKPQSIGAEQVAIGWSLPMEAE
jgi:hypothetical protein